MLFLSPHIKFHPNWMKNAEVENCHYWSGLVGRAGRSKNVCRHFKLILCCFWAIISPYTKFHQNPMKNAEVVNFHYWLVLVGRAGRSKNGYNIINSVLSETQYLLMKVFFPKREIWLVRVLCTKKPLCMSVCPLVDPLVR